MTFNEALINYIETVQKQYNDYFAKNYKSLVPDLIAVEGGQKYVKISHTRDGGKGQKSVHSFIVTEDDPKKNLKEGDILKAASWKAPAKHARGNIFGNINLNGHGHVPYMR